MGHSHAWALRRAALSAGFDRRGFEIDFPILGSKSTPEGLVAKSPGGEHRISDAISNAIPAVADDPDAAPIILSALGGNGHFWVAAAEAPEPFDVIHPRCPRPTPGARRNMPVGLMVDLFRRTDGQLVPLFRLLRARGYERILQISTPPPTAVPGKAVLEKVQALGGVVADPLLVLKLWHCQIDALRTLCAEADAIFVEVPAETVGADGFIRPEFSEDGMHGNTEYAKLALAKALDAATGEAR